ncbi:MAG: TlpA family protein disulfide reductase, partial [Myxococcales bacterium]|nr:TlpA family protein disulfide reductase [Myxococcales bacterium]
MKAKGEVVAALVSSLLGVSLLLAFGQAAWDGQVRAEAAPFRAIVGDEAYEDLVSDQPPALHYIGNDKTAPDFTLPDRQGQPWSLHAHRGKVIVLNFWSITCQPCVEEMPTLIELARLVGDRDDVEVVAVSTDRDWSAVASLFPADHRLTVLFDPDKKVVLEKFGTRLYPETWIVDKEGVIRFRYDGGRDWSSAVILDVL